MKRDFWKTTRNLLLGLFVWAAMPAQAQTNDANRQLAWEIFKQLVAIDTTECTTLAAQGMRQRLLDAGFPENDVRLLGPNDCKMNMVARLHGSGASRPILLICHLDVVTPGAGWHYPPFVPTEEPPYLYGRGTQDVKDGVAIFVANLIQFKQEGYKPARDVILALTADEEGGRYNGVEWLLKNHRDLIDAELSVNSDAGGVESEDGKPVALNVELTEKTYADYQLTVTSLGGHSSLPSRHGNAIRVLADALGRVEGHQFPFELNDVTLEYIEQRSRAEIGQRAADLRAVLSPSPDPKALARISDDPFLNATVRTTCVPTRVNGGQANNALPQKAEAIVNCRILPGHSPEEVRQVLLNIIEDPTVAVHWMAASRDVFDRAPAECGPPPAKPNAAVMNAVKNVVAEMWPGIPTWAMQETGASDGRFTNLAGIPTYGVSGVAIDRDDMRMHGPDERLRITSFYDGLDYYRRLLKKLTSPPGTVSGQGKQSR